MCRLLAYLGPNEPIRPRVFGGEHSLWHQSFRPRELLNGSVNADGWGVVWYAGDGMPVRLARAEPIWFDDDLERVLEVTTASRVLAAVRNTTPGIPRTHEGTPPILYGRWSFVLNGFIPDFRAVHREVLQAELPADQRRVLRGTSDTETLLHMAVAAAREGATPAEALRGVVRTVETRARSGRSTRLNMAFSDGESTALVRWADEGPSNSLYLRGHPEWGGTVASEALEDDGEWTAIPHASLVELREGSPPTVTPL